MEDKGIILSEKHGVNPSLVKCFVCGKDIGIALLGKLKDDAEAPRYIHEGLCDKCQEVVDKKGTMIIEVRDGEKGNNPYRTGRIIGINENSKKAMNIENDICYMEETLFTRLFSEFFNKHEEDETDREQC